MTARTQINPGDRFGSLVALRELPHDQDDKYKRRRWSFQCECGQEKPIRLLHVTSGAIVTCGCKPSTLRHGHTPAGKGSRTYNTWKCMHQRCEKPYAVGFEYYGGRGIKVCDRWKSFDLFLADMGERPAGKTLDRWPNVNGDYEPTNCRWATPKEQAHNKRPRRNQ
jgi:hypothetical protein